MCPFPRSGWRCRMRSIDTETAREFLPCATPPAWIEAALANLPTLLIDHANCEKRAAATALNLMFRHGSEAAFLRALSRLAREELRHFEQVTELMADRGIEYRALPAGRYAAGLHQLVRRRDPGRTVDRLIVAAFIEARSCERFEALAPRLDEQLQAFYVSLLRSESRHFRDYLGFARRAADAGEVSARIAEIAARERELIETPEAEFRFHSGPPQMRTGVG